MLETQFNPHFLFNTLESIRYMIKLDPKASEKMIVDLSRLLRYSISRDEQKSSLREEIEFAERYLNIMLFRFSDKIRYTMETDEELLSNEVPRMILQPVVENAVHYGMESGDDVCHIRLSVELQERELCIKVSNTGSQFPDNFFEALKKKQYTARGFGIGLLNIDQRLRINFGKPYQIRIYNQDDWAIVEMHVPYLPLKEDV